MKDHTESMISKHASHVGVVLEEWKAAINSVGGAALAV
jgi:hypothetical protein